MYSKAIVRKKDRWIPTTWEDYQRVYRRLQKQDANRLNVSSWLGGLSLAAFSALIVSPGSQLSVFDSRHIVFLFVAMLLAIATLIFLAAAYSAYQSIRIVAHLSPTNAWKLENSHDDETKAPHDFEQEKTDPAEPNAPEKSDAERLKKALRIHEEASGSISWGLAFLGLALIGIALEINIVVAVVAIGCLIIISWRSSALVRSLWESRRKK